MADPENLKLRLSGRLNPWNRRNCRFLIFFPVKSRIVTCNFPCAKTQFGWADALSVQPTSSDRSGTRKSDFFHIPTTGCPKWIGYNLKGYCWCQVFCPLLFANTFYHIFDDFFKVFVVLLASSILQKTFKIWQKLKKILAQVRKLEFWVLPDPSLYIKLTKQAKNWS